MIKLGMIIGARYEILEKIGTGGMSDVYKAKCHKLNRLVAVKVLKQEFCENANFVAKFRVEAQAAAGLMHPNIVNVYDVGEEDDIHYIVMELVEGITLKKYIEKKARLSVKEATSIAIQVCMGIEAAHNNHIIHRDIKPQNIIISKEGKVKVTDFGIAKAATSNTVSSNVMGSVHYTSPEQARGGYSDEKSDIYSLGITLFEMLTGRVPFQGDSTVGIAIKHIQEPMPTPRQYVEEIPLSVEQIVLKCCQKSPDRRYQCMAELIDDLKQSLVTPEVAFVKMDEFDMIASTRVATDADIESIKKETTKDPFGDSMRLNKEPDYENQLGADGEDGEFVEPERDRNPKMEKITSILFIIAIILIGLVIILLVGKTIGLLKFNDSDGSQNEVMDMVPMANVIGKDYQTAKDILEELELLCEVSYVESEEYAEGIVIDSSVKEGQQIERFSIVTLTVSSGTNAIDIPTVTGKTYEEAKNVLEKEGFVVTKATGYSETMAEGYVMSQSPAAETKAPIGSTITVTVSLGKEEVKVRVPSILGKTELEAANALTEAGLNLGNITKVNSSEYAEGLVCYQSTPVNSYLEEGSSVDIQVSMGPKAATYSFSGSITGPTAEEDPYYKKGIEVQVILKPTDGKELLNTKVSTFPIETVNYNGITSSTGTLTFIYTVEIGAEDTGEVDDEGNPVILPARTEEHTIQRTIEFVRE